MLEETQPKPKLHPSLRRIETVEIPELKKVDS